MTRGAIHRVGTDRAGTCSAIICNFIRRIQVPTRWGKRQAGGVRIVGNDFELGQCTTGGIHFNHINALPAAAPTFRALRGAISAHARQNRCGREGEELPPAARVGTRVAALAAACRKPRREVRPRNGARISSFLETSEISFYRQGRLRVVDKR